MKTDIWHSEDDVAQILSQALNAHLVPAGTDFTFTPKGEWSDRSLQVTRDRLRRILQSLREKSVEDELVLYSDTTYELFVNVEGPTRFAPRRSQPLAVTDSESGLSYTISEISDEYLVWLLLVGHHNGALRELGIGFRQHRYSPGRYRPDNDTEFTDALAAIRWGSVPMQSLKLSSPTSTPVERFKGYTASFLFHIAYNLDLAYVPQRFFEEITRRGRISRMRRTRPDDLDAPRRAYNDDLVNQYVLAISTDSPTVQFLSHYHVIEHYFESVYNDDLLEQVKMEMTRPDFSYKRKRDIARLVKTIKKSLQVRLETISFSEGDALQLCLARFVDVGELVKRLEDYSTDHLEYYEGNQVPFSKGTKVAFSSGSDERICADLAKRIYATRCSLVHNKDGDKARYTPFRDEKALVKEIPLLRFIAEMVIIANSTVS